MDIILGAIAGDVIGSCYEFTHSIPDNFTLFNEFSKYTDDTVLTIAVLDCLQKDDIENCEDYLKVYTKKYPNSGFGPNFFNWAQQPNGYKSESFGNGAAMRVSAIGAFCKTEAEIHRVIQLVTTPSHNHSEALKGAAAIAISIFKAKNGESKEDISHYVLNEMNYDLSIDFDEIRAKKNIEVICQTTVPRAISCFLQSYDYESCIRLAVSIGGDTDTVACMAGGIAAAYYGGIPSYIKEETLLRLPFEFQTILKTI